MKMRTRTADLIWDPRGIITLTFLNDTELDLESARENGEAIKKLSNTTPHVLICDLNGLKSTTREAKEEGKVGEYVSLILATGLITNTKIGRIIGNLFISFTSPAYPIKMFNSEEECRKWALSILESKKKLRV